jgi:hypothetical protein
LLLALAYHKQGKADEAKRTLAGARFVLEQETPLRQAGLLLGGGLGGPLPAATSAAVHRATAPRWDWAAALEVRLLRAEAERLIDPPAPKPDR